jgi:hypothetical protein
MKNPLNVWVERIPSGDEINGWFQNSFVLWEKGTGGRRENHEGKGIRSCIGDGGGFVCNWVYFQYRGACTNQIRSIPNHRGTGFISTGDLVVARILAKEMRG